MHCELCAPAVMLSERSMQRHQSYQPLLPCVNKYLQYKWDRSCYEMHRKKVQSAKATINTNPPKIYDHLLVKRKKLKLEEERFSTIERENHMLLDKITQIMRTTGRTDCRNDYVTKSLCRDKRQQELLQIVKENQLIFQRLSQSTPYYSVQQWHEQWLKTLDLMENIGRFPYINSIQKLSNKNNTKNAKRMTPDNLLSQGKEHQKHPQKLQEDDTRQLSYPEETQGSEKDKKTIQGEYENNSEYEDEP